MNLEVINAGYAEVYRGTPAAGFDNAPYWKAKKEFRVAKRGMWVQGESYESPRDFGNGCDCLGNEPVIKRQA